MRNSNRVLDLLAMKSALFSSKERLLSVTMICSMRRYSGEAVLVRFSWSLSSRRLNRSCSGKVFRTRHNGKHTINVIFIKCY